MYTNSPAAARATTFELPESGIVTIANYASNKPDVIPLWVGEGDLPTPQFINEAVAKSLADGETFYTYQRGIPELRAALADYHQRLYGIPFSSESFFVTGSGMQSIVIALQAIAETGDEIVFAMPSWPNIEAAAIIAGVRPIGVALDYHEQGWQLDIGKLLNAVTPNTKALFVNSPSNPAGWVASREDLKQILDFARKRGLWIISDEVYARFVYDADLAPSFYQVSEPEDRILYSNTFSKNWAMTGWRMGWISGPPELGDMFENLIQNSTSGVAAFMQRGAVCALNDGEEFVCEQVWKATKSRGLLLAAFAQNDRIRFAPPAGTFYLLFSVDGQSDTTKLAFRLIDEAGVGVAPGTAFCGGADGFMRLCFQRDPAQIREAASRLMEWLDRN